MRVLVTEDDEMLAMTLAAGLRREGMAVDVTLDGAAALEHLTGLEITVCHFPPGTQCRCLCAAKQFMVTLRWRSRWYRHASMGGFVRSCAAGGGGPVGDPGACRRGA
jgi:hypothetical protein